MRQQSPNLKQSRASSAQQNNSVAVSQIEKSKIEKQQQAVTKHDKMKSYAKEQQNVSKKHETIEPTKLIEQNMKLKEQLQELIVHLDNIVKNQKEKQKVEKEKKFAKPLEPADKKSILNQQEKQINDNIAQIKLLSKQLEQTYDINKIKEKEDKKRYLENEYQKLYKEYESQQKIDQKQNEGLKQMDLKEQQQIIAQLKKELQEEQKTSRNLIEEINKYEKDVQKFHNERVTKLKQISDLQQKIAQKKRNKQAEEEVDDNKLKQLEDEIIELQKKKDEQMKNYSEKYKKLEYDRNQMKNEVEKKRMLMIKLERDTKINRVFIHEANRYLRLEDKNSQRSSKPVFSAPRKPTTPRKETPSPKSDKGSIRKNPSQNKVETIKEEQFEETVPNLEIQQQNLRQPRSKEQTDKNTHQHKDIKNQEISESIENKEEQQENIQIEKPIEQQHSLHTNNEEETKSLIDQNDNNTQQNQQIQQPNIYRKPMMMLKKK
ncbi:unnamed protein product [Paramecium pentaurelia]|uniref:Uncharacterized protein n=1 Tax=Paramecium pentaurelia TaxID=43138 RepID=A0A8S1Y213_9CILI|nr:unnamed protein product [Paramecium pentaurelia]